MGHRKGSPFVLWIVPLVIGLAGLHRVTQSPTFEIYRAVDIVQLLVSGACFGATMVGVTFMFRQARD